MPVTELDPAFLSPESLDSPCFVFLRNKTPAGRAAAISCFSTKSLELPVLLIPARALVQQLTFLTTPPPSKRSSVALQSLLLKINESMQFYIYWPIANVKVVVGENSEEIKSCSGLCGRSALSFGRCLFNIYPPLILCSECSSWNLHL